MKNQYIGITIGPIYDTMGQTSKPAGLWAASFLFSHIAESICKGLVRNKLVENPEDIISPYFDPAVTLTNGIGMYHDRIIFQYTGDPKSCLEKVSKLFGDIADEIADYFKEEDNATKTWFRQYLQFHAFAFEAEENEALVKAGKPLDAIELEKTFPLTSTINLEKFLEDNEWVKKFAEAVGVSAKEWALLKDQNNLKDIGQIIGYDKNNSKQLKTGTYYAIVQSDGDHMGDYISSQKNPRDFSRKCLQFCKEAAEIIQNYGGVPIYAGGDDLLFIAPLTGIIEGNSSCLIDLLKKIQKRFNSDKFFGVGKDLPTISFGVSICYHKYPLYESFKEACDMLFGYAKDTRNAAAISLHKHSGQSVKFVIHNFDDNAVIEHVSDLIRKHSDEEDKWLKSVSTKIWSFAPLFKLAISDKGNLERSVENIFKNTFDNIAHQKDSFKDEISNTKKLFLETLKFNSEIPPVKEVGTGDRELEELQALDALLRFVKFHSEKGRED